MNSLPVPQNTAEWDLVELWIARKRSPHTRRAYRQEIKKFYAWLGKPLSQATLFDANDYIQSLAGADNSLRLTMNVLSSFYGFAVKTGLFQINVMAALASIQAKSAISERIMPEWAVHRMIALEEQPRNHCLLIILYASGARVSEICNLKWKHVIEHGEGGQIDVLGKGDKKRSILLHGRAWMMLCSMRGKCIGEDYVFQSRQSVSRAGVPDGKRLDPRSVWKIVKDAAIRAGVPDKERAGDVSPHWLRHSHASHSLDHHAPISVVRDTLGHSSIAVTNTYIHSRPNESSSTYLTL